MPKFYATYEVVGYYGRIIEADTIDDAKEIAKNQLYEFDSGELDNTEAIIVNVEKED